MTDMYEVEWCSELPVNEFGDCEPDLATYVTKYFKSIDHAREYAKEVYPLDEFGAVRITPCHLEPYEPGLPGTYLEYDGDSEYYEGPEE